MTRITTPFGFHSTAQEVIEGVDLTGKRAIVTGGASGIGIETARALVNAGANVTLAVRRPEAAESIAAELRSGGRGTVDIRSINLADLSSVKSFAESWSGPLDILVNNAGIMAVPQRELTSQGWEMQFATNFLGHFALVLGLQNALIKAEGARIVSLSSNANLLGPVVFDDINFDFRTYDAFASYAQAKSACALIAVEITRRWAKLGIFANALNPGAIATNLQKHTGGLKTPIERQKNVQQGAATSVLLAASPLLEGIGGRYFEDCNEALVVTKRPADYRGVAAYAVDPDNAQRLWEVATRMTVGLFYR
ncbi:SDR family NAD(P)-dependent oxidoreductase [Pseudomonas gregormendelii]|uniref:SDR family NAD(P)-dependent oxidoreductase n=1 Tax=Pseudomonas gregormendelii TaxID=1628277 RepID=A0ABS3AFY1_9PSED|nr:MULTISPECIES: SDR family NAD(P)-dependent oxidoreductase [Pseudomonas]KJH75160.1 oxidoreductase [Pseudomonas sp. ES3-33]MBN3965726.1 SDR family NAD(P)-dependent oxidoreductase [Pseudomonas gregormendelii]